METKMKPTFRERLRMLLPHMITPCVRCGEAAGFWVFARDGRTVRRPWCLACLDGPGGPDRDTVRIEPFDA